MNVEELKFAAIVRSLASEIFDEHRQVAIRNIQKPFTAEERDAKVLEWDDLNPFKTFIDKALDELENVAVIIRRRGP
jgi:hypothetical protein